jgi:predicted dehydrogenase
MKVAVLGLGSAGSRHARILLELGHEVLGFDPAASSTPEGVARIDSLQAAIDAADAVVIASPNSLHAEQALLALARRRHVLIEKPLAVAASDAAKVAEAAQLASVVCGVAMNLRFHPGILELKRLVDERALGAVRFVQASFGYDLRRWHRDSDYRLGYSARAELGGGIVLDAIHELDYLLWIFGAVHAVSAETAHVSELEIDVEDVAVAALRFESGAIASVDLNFVEPAYRRSCIVVGSDKAARWDWTSATIAVTREGEDERIIEVSCELTETYRATTVDFIDSIEQAAMPRTSVHDGLAAVNLAEYLKASAQSGRRCSIRPA